MVNFPICHSWQATRDSYGNFFPHSWLRHSMGKNLYHISPQWWYETLRTFWFLKKKKTRYAKPRCTEADQPFMRYL